MIRTYGKNKIAQASLKHCRMTLVLFDIDLTFFYHHYLQKQCAAKQSDGPAHNLTFMLSEKNCHKDICTSAIPLTRSHRHTNRTEK